MCNNNVPIDELAKLACVGPMKHNQQKYNKIETKGGFEELEMSSMLTHKDNI